MSLKFDLTELTKALSELEKKVQTSIATEALEAGAKPIKQEQLQLVPVDTGELKNSIKITPIKNKKGRHTINIGVPKEAGRHNVEKAWFTSNGCRGRAGTFWLNQSFENKSDEAIEAMVRVLKEKIK